MFFKQLDDNQHTAAGEFIIGKKRESEDILAECVGKRRRFTEGIKAEVEKVADIRVTMLGKTEELRGVLKGGVGRVLRESGLAL
jgi:hypothetical protein